jgi:hypothetical protein
VLYYKWGNDPYIPPNCVAVARQATDMLNGWIKLGVAAAQLAWIVLGGDPTRISAGCDRNWPIGPQNVQMQLFSQAAPTRPPFPDGPAPTSPGRADLATCVNGTLPRAPGGGVN